MHTTAPALKPFVGQILPAPDWHRRAAGAPIETEVIALNRELTQLQAQRALERNQLQQTEARRREALHDEMHSLLKQSVLGGHVEIKRMANMASAQDWVAQPGRFLALPLDNAARTPLRVGELLRWEMPTQYCTLVMSANGIPSWNREGTGTLTITSERIFCTIPGQRLWQLTFGEIQDVMLHPLTGQYAGQFNLELISPKLPVRTSFTLADITRTLVLDGSLIEMTVTPKEVANIVRSLVEQS